MPNTTIKDPKGSALKLFDMAWPDVVEMIKKTDVVVVPTGSVEHHGPHLPCGFDSYAGYHVCMEACKKANVPMAPLQPFGYSPFHMRPGTLTLSSKTYIAVMYDIGRSLIFHGFNKLVFVTGHTSNLPSIDFVIRSLRYDTGAMAFSYAGDSETFAPHCMDLIEGKDQLPGWHSGEIETSGAMLFIPELVRKERMEKQLPFTPAWLPEGSKKISGSGHEMKFKEYPVRFPFENQEYTKTGVAGNPMLASAEKGKKIYDRMTDLLAEFLVGLKNTEWKATNREFPERW
jgi:creatinine amidohydrolase